MVDKTFVKVAGTAAAQGHYATSIGAAATFLPSAAKFVADYKAKYNSDDYAIYGPSTYDAANIILDGLAKVLAGKSKIDSSVRKDLIGAIQATNYNGALGHTSFDKYGDTTNRLLTINRVVGDDFKPLKKLTVA
jgi:branched-chain amino acid transport system substrate-binding protein